MDRSSALSRLRPAVMAFARRHPADRWCVGLSGGADSLALTAVAAAVKPTTALIVDHGLQTGSADVAAAAAAQSRQLGCVDAQVICVSVGTDGGPEAAARTARYDALDAARGGAPVLLAHTLDDQAETVLLGLGRGSGPRSIAGMRVWDPPWGRPFLDVRRADTEAACAELGLTPWQDPHNTDPRYTRVRLRAEVLPLLEDVLAGGVAPALARTAAALREDNDALDALAAGYLAALRTDSVHGIAAGLTVAGLEDLPAALRRRVIRGWLLSVGATALTDVQLRAVDALVGDWRGQGGAAVSSPLRYQRLVVTRRAGLLTVAARPV
ncbi:tRNA lysidine(34) synthetase TilS [Mycolicibacterium sp. CBMA 226]|uniref:tRNA lysidine(34) synthetase TilS n=1 Tax=Mycolicibacterium sp. CBMA 226 TaxID=2606611 RepID=UPI0012DF970B|nr:tRNA lysidine(34) synthetase TilS [Mycolicibacterium sp. CBMA 226]MUL79692.1 tRNA lysidine(34) synthetase TilS [Mycolicibacterium sp. CBMA 226]